jgi:arsenate reductase-like glutaredoxin family protein
MKNLIIVMLAVALGYLGYQKFISKSETTLEPLYETPYVVVYGKTTCGWTQKCLRELKEQNIDTIFENIEEQEVQRKIFSRIDAAGLDRNRIVIPIVDVNGHILIGYEPDKIIELYERY